MLRFRKIITAFTLRIQTRIMQKKKHPVRFIFTTVKPNRLRCARYEPRLKHGVPAEYEKSK